MRFPAPKFSSATPIESGTPSVDVVAIQTSVTSSTTFVQSHRTVDGQLSRMASLHAGKLEVSIKLIDLISTEMPETDFDNFLVTNF